MRESFESALFSRRAASRRVFAAFAVAALAVVQSGGSAPTPIYRLYQQNLGLSPAMVTMVFAVYPLSLLVSLLTAGSLSDHVGRRAVILAAMLLSGMAMAIFVVAHSFTGLLLARVLQGLATGIAASSLGAAILDVNPDSGSLVNSVTAFLGTTIGALLSSVLVEFGPAPTRLVYAILLVTFLSLAVAVRWMPETTPAERGARISFVPRIALPKHVRGIFWMVSPVNVAGWALGGFYLSLMPAVFRAATGSTSALLGGSVIASLTLAGAAFMATARQRDARTVLLRGATALILGVAISLAGVLLSTVPLLALGTVVAGVGFGGSFFGAARSILPQAKLHERAGVLSAFYVESYVAFSVPAVLIALLVPSLGLRTCTYLYGVVVMLLAIGSLVVTWERHEAT